MSNGLTVFGKLTSTAEELTDVFGDHAGTHFIPIDETDYWKSKDCTDKDKYVCVGRKGDDYPFFYTTSTVDKMARLVDAGETINPNIVNTVHTIRKAGIMLNAPAVV